MEKSKEQRIYVVVAETIQVPVTWQDDESPLRTVAQPIGRQVAQACHAVSKLRLTKDGSSEPIITIVLQARDSAELDHVFFLLTRRHLRSIIFSDNNPEYGPGNWPTAIAVLATQKQISGILDYLPLWGK